MTYYDLNGNVVSSMSTSNEVSSVAVTGVTPPVGGAYPDMSAEASAGVCTPVGVSWTDALSAPVASSEPFTAGQTYTAAVTLLPADGKAFTESTTVTVNGSPVLGAVLNTDQTITATVSFVALEAGVSYQLASSISDGREYALVFDGAAMSAEPKQVESDAPGEMTTYYGMDTCLPTISGDTLTFEDQTQALASTWTLDAVEGGYAIRNGSQYLYVSGERNLVLDSQPHTFSYGEQGEDGNQLYVTLDERSMCFATDRAARRSPGWIWYIRLKNNANVLKLYEKSGSIIPEEPEPDGTVYKEVTALTAGRNYILTASEGTVNYAVAFQTVPDTEYRVGAVEVTVSDGAEYLDGTASLAGTDVIVTENAALSWMYDDEHIYEYQKRPVLPLRRQGRSFNRRGRGLYARFICDYRSDTGMPFNRCRKALRRRQQRLLLYPERRSL
jgi:hypothetical protein